MKKPYYLILLIVGFSLLSLALGYMLSSCVGGKNDIVAEKQDPVGKYVYYDDNGVLHVSEYCDNLRFGKDRNGHNIYTKHPKETKMITKVDKLCAECVHTEEYEYLRRIAIGNKPYEQQRKWLWGQIKQYYDGDFIVFYEEFENELEDIEGRKVAYHYAQCEEIEEGLSFGDFCRNLGYDNYQNLAALKLQH